MTQVRDRPVVREFQAFHSPPYGPRMADSGPSAVVPAVLTFWRLEGDRPARAHLVADMPTR